MNNDVTLTGGENPLLAGRYQVVRQLGTGGMGSVWLAEDRQLDNKLFAVKMLPSILVANKRAYRQLKDEALVAMKLVHPNIVQIRAFEENNGNPFLVMDYINGQTLDDYLAEKGKLTEDETVRLLKPIASALDYAHGEGVVHRDVKPANVMIRKDGRPFIMDFGIAREIQETLTRVTGKMSSGTLMYMSPEQLHGAPPNKFQDIYSFAAMAYECLTGRAPFCRGQIEYQIDHDDPAPLSGDIAIASSVMAGLAKKPDDRPKSCVAVLEKKVGRIEPAGRASSRADETESIAAVNEDSNIRITKGFSTTESQRSENSEIECLRRRVDAKIQKKAIDELPDFESDKKLLNDIFFKAELLFESKLWSDALSEFTVYVKNASDLLLRRKGIEEAKVAVAKVEVSMPKHGAVKTVLLPGHVPMRMIYVAPGSFEMGSPIEEIGRCEDELLHQVNLTKGFWLGKYPVTQRQWESVMGFNPSYFKGLDNPVEMVSWNDCQKFIATCNKELQKEFAGEVRLPTEAEWEYACRAGSKRAYSGTGKLDDMGWYDNTIFGFGITAKEVGLKSSNAWGFYDMHGNVCEWCQDWYGDYPKDEVTDPKGPASGDNRVLRGGSWFDGARICRSAYRYRSWPGYRRYNCGFRLCCSVGP